MNSAMDKMIVLVALCGWVAACGGSDATPALDSMDVPEILERRDDGVLADGKDRDAPNISPEDLAGADHLEIADPGLPLDPGPPEVSGGSNDLKDIPYDPAADPADGEMSADSVMEDPGAPGDPGGPEEPRDPATAGPWKTRTVKTEVRRDSRIIPVVAHVPEGPGPWPLVLFLPGFQLSSDLYQGTVDRLATHGFLTVRATPPGSPINVNHVEMRRDAQAVIDWALSESGPLVGLADPARIGVMGHSLGGKVSVMTAFADNRVQAVFAMDPVNGGHPITGYSSSLPDIVPDQVAPLAIPLGFPGEDWNATHTAFLSPPCAPADQNYRTFYAAAASSPWKAMWSLDGADHMDFVDDPASCGFTCSVCPDGPGEDQAQIAAVRTLMVAFFRRHLGQETAMEAWLTGFRLPAEVSAIQHSP